MNTHTDGQPGGQGNMKKPFPAPRYADTLDNRTIALEINCYDGPTNDERNGKFSRVASRQNSKPQKRKN